jgi:molybdate transport system substrate-binding protein
MNVFIDRLKNFFRRFRSISALVLVLANWGSQGAWAKESKLSLFAAASLTTVLSELAPHFESETGSDVNIVFAGSGALARQIENKAPADLFMSANEQWMSYLADSAMIDPGSQRIFATNRLALIAPAATTWSIELEDPDIGDKLSNKPFAIADPESVPAGIYAAQALRTLGIHDALALAFAPDVRVALAWVARGDAGAGLVYVTDTITEPRTRIITLIPDDGHGPITYWAARVTESKNNLASVFLDFLVRPETQTLLVSHGFGLPNGAPLDLLQQSP